MNEAVTSAEAHTVVPSARPAWRNQSVAKMRAAQPDPTNTRQSAAFTRGFYQAARSARASASIVRDGDVGR